MFAVDLQLAVSEALCVGRSCALAHSSSCLLIYPEIIIRIVNNGYVLSAQAQERDPLCYTVCASLTGLTYPATVCSVTSGRICLGNFDTTR